MWKVMSYSRNFPHFLLLFAQLLCHALLVLQKVQIGQPSDTLTSEADLLKHDVADLLCHRNSPAYNFVYQHFHALYSPLCLALARSVFLRCPPTNRALHPTSRENIINIFTPCVPLFVCSCLLPLLLLHSLCL